MDKRGKEVTPWLLKRVGELTKGKALQSSELSLECEMAAVLITVVDIALIENNARIGGRIAAELNTLQGGASSVSISGLARQYVLTLTTSLITQA